MAYSAWSVVFGEQPSAAKWNILGSNDAHFYSFLGDNLAWQSWTPTGTNFTIGNGTYACAYIKIGKTVICRFKVTLGNTSSMGSDPTFTLPLTASAASSAGHLIGNLYVEDSGTAAYYGVIRITSTTTFALNIQSAGATYVAAAGINSTSPFTWTTNDFVAGYFVYEAA